MDAVVGCHLSPIVGLCPISFVMFVMLSIVLVPVSTYPRGLCCCFFALRKVLFTAVYELWSVPSVVCCRIPPYPSSQY